MRLTVCYVFFLGMLFCSKLFSQVQNNMPEYLLSSLEKSLGNYPSENLYVQTSKDVYELGEDLWFKGYVLNSQYLLPSSLSNTMYVQLIEDKTDLVVWEEKYEVLDGFVDGHIFVQDSLRVGLYKLVTYTPHSLQNDGEPLKSIRKLNIVENIINNPKPQASLPNEGIHQGNIDFQLFPEGGQIVLGLENRIAFKAVDSKGHPKEVSGILYGNGVPVTTFKSTHAGMGDFKLVPDLSIGYHIELDSITGSLKEYPLPPIKKSGYILHLLYNAEDTLSINVSKNALKSKETVYIRLQIRGEVYSIAKVLLSDKSLVKIPLKDFPQGIAEITLFDSSLQPVAERLVYIKQEQRLRIRTLLDKGEYFTKQQVNLKIKVVDQFEKPVVANLGLSIFDGIYENPNGQKNIETHYQLSSQLKGDIYHPAYYFDQDNLNRKEALDLLLLTQGWRSYVWNENNLRHDPLNINLTINDTVKGFLYPKKNRNGSNVMASSYVVAFTAEKDDGTFILEVDTEGHFIIQPEYIKSNSVKLHYFKLLGNDPKINDKLAIFIKDQAFETINKLRKQKTYSYPMESVQNKTIEVGGPLVVSNDANRLEEVLIKTKKGRVFRDKYMATLDSLSKLELTSDYVCMVAGEFHKNLNCPMHKYNHSEHIKPIEGESYWVIVGFEWIDETKGTFRVSGYKRVTYRYPHLSEEDLLKKFNLAVVKGYYRRKKFYEPVYDKTDQENGFPDYRNTLFWKPDIVTNGNGEATVSFYCSDINTKFIGRIEGVGEDGLLGIQHFSFMTRKRK